MEGLTHLRPCGLKWVRSILISIRNSSYTYFCKTRQMQTLWGISRSMVPKKRRAEEEGDMQEEGEVIVVPIDLIEADLLV